MRWSRLSCSYIWKSNDRWTDLPMDDSDERYIHVRPREGDTFYYVVILIPGVVHILNYVIYSYDWSRTNEQRCLLWYWTNRLINNNEYRTRFTVSQRFDCVGRRNDGSGCGHELKRAQANRSARVCTYIERGCAAADWSGARVVG